MIDDEPVVVRFHLDPAEMELALAAHARAAPVEVPRKPGPIPAWVLLVVIPVAVGSAFLRPRIVVYIASAGLALGVALLLGILAFVRLAPVLNRRSFETSVPERLRDQEYEIGEADIVTRSPHSATRIEWEGVERVVEDPDGFLIYIGPSTYHWLPRHAFESGAEAERFAGIAAARGRLARPKPEPLTEI